MKLKLAFALTIAALLSGCVTGTRTIDLQPPQVATTTKMEGTVYLGAFEDKRVFEAAPKDPSTPSVNGNLASTSKQQLATLIGRQRNGFGKAMGDVALPKGGTVEGEMRDLIRRGLEARGYRRLLCASHSFCKRIEILLLGWSSLEIYRNVFALEVGCEEP